MTIFYKAYKAGKGGLETAHPAAELAAGFIVSGQTDTGRTFALFKDPQAFRSYIEELPLDKRTYYEIILGHVPQKIKFDIDMKNTSTAAAEAEVCKVIESSMELLDVKFDDFIVSSSHGEGKHSFHVVLDHHYVETNIEAHYVYSHVSENLGNPKWLDPMVYSTKQQFRIEGNRKSGSDRVKTHMSRINGKQLKKSSWSDTLITNIEGCKHIDLVSKKMFAHARRIQQLVVDARRAGVDALAKKWERDVVETQGKPAKKCKPGIILTQELHRKVLALIEPGVLEAFTVREVVGDKISFYRAASSYCDICMRTHDSDNSMYVRLAPRGHVHRYCYKSKGKSKYLGRISTLDPRLLAMCVELMASLHPPSNTHKWQSALKAPFQPTDLQFPASVSTIKYNKKYMKPFPDCSTLFVHAGMGLGKTFALTEYIEHTKPQRVLMVSFRITFTQAVAQRFNGFTVYSEHAGELNHDRLIVQAESLHRVKLKKTDLLVLDECESILEQWESPNFVEFNGAWRTFCAFLRDCPRVVCMDAFLGQRTVDFVQRVRTLNDTTYVHNTYQNKQDYNMTIAPPGMQSTWVAQLMAAIEKGKHVVVPTNSKKQADILHRLVSEKFPHKSVKLYSSDTPEATKKKDFANVKEAFKVDVLIYTPTMSAGVSYEEEHFDVLYGFFTDRSCGYKTCVQMLGRVRSLKDKHMNVCLATSAPPRKSESVEELDQEYDADRDRLFKHGRKHRFDLDYRNWETTLKKNDYYHLFLANKAVENRSRNRFRDLFLNAVKSSGVQCVMMQGKADTQTRKDIKEAKTSLAKEDCEGVAGSKDLSEDQADSLHTERRIRQLTTEEQYALRKYDMRAAYRWKGNITPAFVNTYDTRSAKQQFRNLTVISKYKSIDEALKEIGKKEAATMMYLNREHNSRLHDERLDTHQKKVWRKHTVAHSLILACGFDHLHDRTTVSRKQLVKRLKGSEFDARDIARLFDKRNNKINTDDLKSTLAFINSVLRSWYGVRIGARSTSRDGRKTFVIHTNPLFNGPNQPAYDNKIK